MAENRQWHLARLSTPSALKVLTTLGELLEPVGAVALATAAGVSERTTREVLSRAIRVNLAVRYDGDRPTDAGRFALTTAGWGHIAACKSTFIDGDEAANAVDDQSSSTTMTTPRGRRGKPAWCTPGQGVCICCQEPS